MKVAGLVALVASASACTVQLGHTTIVGVENSSLEQESFYGIPFAEPPIGALRLRPPVGKFSLGQETFHATTFGPACIQVPSNASTPLSDFSEDCLTLNILRPAGIPKEKKLPVLVWVYGGGFYAGASSSYPAGAIVARSVNRNTPVIYVSLNYRLGPLGFPQGAEAAARGALNLGLKDQLMALEWVNKNIAAFGGDPEKVTVWGQSAGAISIAIHLLRPSFKRLARAVFLQSGSAGTTTPNNATLQQPAWSSFVAAIPQCARLAAGKNSFECIQNATLSTPHLVNATEVALLAGNVDHLGDSGFVFAPTFDGPDGLLPGVPSEILRAGSYAHIPLITSTVRDEGTLFVDPTLYVNETVVEGGLLSIYSPSLLPTNGTAVLEATIGELLDLYPPVPSAGSPFGTGNQTFGYSATYKQMAAIISDVAFGAQRRALQRASATHGVRSYGYLFMEPQPQVPAYEGIPHASDVQYLYGSCVGLSATCPTLSRTMMDYLLSFATGLDPNDKRGAPRPQWLPYANKSATILQFGGNATASIIPDTYRAEQFAFIEENALVFHE